MMSQTELDALLRKFDREFDASFEDRAAQQRGAFLRAFPRASLKTMTLDEYVIGKQLPSFCAYVEPSTRLWANILGATSAAYYNEVRTHLALGKDAPPGRAVQRSGNIVAIPILSGLHHHYVRI
jgi:hypothetical protein